MLIARHRRTGLVAIEAFEIGIGVPLIRHPVGKWQPGCIEASELFDEFEDLAFSLPEAVDLVETARQVWVVLARALDRTQIDTMTVADVSALLRQRRGTDVVQEQSLALSMDLREQVASPPDYVPIHVTAKRATGNVTFLNDRVRRSGI